jgi:hypothetical protein
MKHLVTREPWWANRPNLGKVTKTAHGATSNATTMDRFRSTRPTAQAMKKFKTERDAGCRRTLRRPRPGFYKGRRLR